MVDWSGYMNGPDYRGLVQSQEKAVNAFNAGQDTAFDQGLKRDANAQAWDANSRAWDQNSRANAAEGRASQLFPFQLSEEQHKSIARADEMLGSYAQILEGAKNPDGTVDQNKWNLFRQRAQQSGIAMPWVRGDDPQGDYERTAVVTKAAADKARIARQMAEANLAIAQDKTESQWSQTGVDAMGNPQHGWVDSRNKQVTPYASQSSSTNIRTDLHGDEFLQTLDPLLAGQIKGIAEGRLAVPTNPRDPRTLALTRLLAQYDPQYDATVYAARAATRKDFAAGRASQNLTSFNTVLGHLGELDKSIEGLNNMDTLPFLNAPINSVMGKVSGDFQTRLTDFETKKKTAVDELVKAFRGSGGSVGDIENWMKTLDSAKSPAALHQAVRAGVSLLQSRIDSLGEQYSRGMGVNKNGIELLNPHARETYERIIGGANGQPRAQAAPLIQQKPQKADAEILQDAQQFLQKHPDKRDAVVQQLKTWGINVQ